MNIRNFLKKNRFIYNLNAKIKASKTKKESEKLINHYNRISAENGISYDYLKVSQNIKDRLNSRGIQLLSKNKGDLTIFWVGACKEQDYSGFVQGLEKYGRIIFFQNSKGNYGQEFNTKKYDPNIVASNSINLLNQIYEIINRGVKIDILIGQMWAHTISVETLIKVQELGIITVNISMDDRLPELWQKHENTLLGSIGLSNGLDLVLTSSPECCIRYLVHGCQAIFWPMASDPDIFSPADKKDIDVCFVGNNYGNRRNIIRKLQKRGIKVEAYGSGWTNGYIGPNKIAEVFGRSKIILGIGTIAYTKDIFTLKLRDFDATMSGALYITHRNPDLLNIFTESKEIECYLTEYEAIDKISYYLNNPDLREKIATEAASKARKLHTWEKRIGEAFSTLGLVN